MVSHKERQGKQGTYSKVDRQLILHVTCTQRNAITSSCLVLTKCRYQANLAARSTDEFILNIFVLGIQEKKEYLPLNLFFSHHRNYNIHLIKLILKSSICHSERPWIINLNVLLFLSCRKWLRTLRTPYRQQKIEQYCLWRFGWPQRMTQNDKESIMLQHRHGGRASQEWDSASLGYKKN